MLSVTSPDTPNQTVKVAAVTHQEPVVASRRESCDRGLKPVALSHEFRGGLCQRRPWRHRRVDPRGTAAITSLTSLTSADATAEDLARMVREHWSIEAHHYIRDVTFGEDAATSRTGRWPVNLPTIRAAVIAALKDAGYLHIPEGRRDHVTAAETLRLHGLD
jgi:predicted transposase YbfD/YdcC